MKKLLKKFMMIKNSLHTPVLLNESINLLNVNPNGVYVDCTAGRGGHSSAILNKLSTNGRLVCVDVDDEAITYLTNLFKQYKCITVVKGNFKDLPKILESININIIDGIIADLGVSSPMFDNPERGFSYHHDSVLDMRMDQNQEIDAKYVINNYSFKQLNDIFREYGDIINPTKVVNNIIKTRSHHEITTTKELVDIIKSSLS
jgi:16S rRNA (cytosine1402-N4)-methyltransferase